MNSFLQWLLNVDTGELAGGGDWRFGFVAEYNNYVILALIAALAAMVLLTIRTYRREGDAPRGVKAALGAIRIAAIVLIFLCICRPAIILRYVKTLHSSVVVLFDDSLSMSFKDRYASSDVAEFRQRLAARLGLDANDEIDLTRSQIGRSILLEPLVRLSRDHPLVFMAYSTSRAGEEAYTRPLGTVNRIADDPSGPVDPAASDRIGEILAGLRSDGYETNHAAALRAAIERTRGRRIAGFIVLSDGRVTSRRRGAGLTSALAYAAERGVRIYPVLVGDPTPLKNVAVTSLRAPREVRRGARMQFVAWVAWQNIAGQSVTVRLERRDPKTREWVDTGVAMSLAIEDRTRATKGAATRGLQKVALTIEPKDLGQFDYRAIIDPLADEQSADDNAAETIVRVADNKIRVLFISGDAGWEFQYIRDYLLGQPELYRLSVWQQNMDKGLDQSGSDGMKLAALPRKLSDLMGAGGNPNKPGYDVVILYDPQFTEGGFDKHFVDKLLKPFVQEHGAGLCYIAGNKYSETNLLSGDTFASLRDMLPVSLAVNTVTRMIEQIERRVSEPWPVRLTAYGVDHPVTRLGPSSEQSATLWAQMPGIFWSHPVHKAKPAARVLAESSNPSYRTADNEPLPLIATQPFGRGRVLYVGFDATWRWRYIEDGFYFRWFWGNVVRHLASLKARRVVITAGGDRFNAGKEITIDVTAYDERFQPLTDETFEVEMIKLDGGDGYTAATGTAQPRKITLKAVEGKPGQYRLTIKAVETGDYELVAWRGRPNADKLVAGKRIVIDLPKAEAQRPEADKATMTAMATRPENFLHATRAGALAEMIPHGRLTSVDDRPRELWDSKLTLLLVVLLLAIEWIVRKKYNMA